MRWKREPSTRPAIGAFLVFSRILAGPGQIAAKFMMMLIVYVTFSVLPIATLLYFQIKFLPYHEVSITYWHRIAVILGFAMLILLTPIMQRAPPKRRWDVGVGPQTEAWKPPARKCSDAFASPARRRLQLADRHRARRMDRSASRVRRPGKHAGRAGDEAKLLNPLVRRIVYDRLPKDNDKGWWRRWLLSYRVLIVEETDRSR